MGPFWEVEDDGTIGAGGSGPARRSAVNARFGVTLPAGDTWVAIIVIVNRAGLGDTCQITFPFSFIVANYTGATGALEAAIDTECRSRLLTLRNAAALTTIRDRRHVL